MYTGREIAVFTDVHGLLEPLEAIITDIKRRGIKEIYSLGDNIGVGPNPREVLELLEENHVLSINGNSEEYAILGTDPFISYFTPQKQANRDWTHAQLTPGQIRNLQVCRHSYDLSVGGKKIALCHFINDVRMDYDAHSTWSYQAAVRYGSPNPTRQFHYTNSPEQQREVARHAQSGSSYDRGFASAARDPLFGGKTIDQYDEIIQGHVHFRMLSKDKDTVIRTIRAAGMAYDPSEPNNMASYIIIRERTDGYEIEEILVPFDRKKMEERIRNSTMPDNSEITRFTTKR